MLENIHLYTRLFVLVCAAVMSFIMCSDTARATQIKRQAEPGVEHRVFRRLFIPNNHQLFSGPPSTETGVQSGTSSKTETTWNHKDISSIIDHRSKPVLLPGNSFVYRPNRPDNKHVYTAVSVQSRTQLDDDISANNNLLNFERLQPRGNNLPTNRHMYNSNSAIIRKSSHTEAATPVYQSSSPSQIWNPNAVQKSYHQEQETLPVNGFSSKVGDKAVWQQYDHSPFSSQARRYLSTSLPTQRRHYSNNRETNELPEPGGLSSSRVIQARNYLGSASQTAPHVPSNRNRLDAYVIENNAEPQRSSIMGFSQGWKSERGSETPGRKNVQSYLFKDSQTSLNTGVMKGQSTFPTTTYVQKPSGGQFSSDFQQKVPTKTTLHSPESVNALYQTKATVAKTQPFVHPFLDTRESFVPTLRGQPDVITPSTSGSMQPQKSVQTNKSVYGFRGFENPAWRTLKEPSSLLSGGLNDSRNSQQYTFDKGKIKMPNVHPSLSQKYSFRRRGLTTNPIDRERQQTGISDIIKTRSTPMPITPKFMQVHSQKPESDAGLDSKSDNRKFGILRRVYGLKGFSNHPPGGAKALPSQPEMSTRVQQDLEGSNLRSSRIWQPEISRIQRYGLNKTSGPEQENELKLPPKMSGSADPTHRATPKRYKNYRRIYNFRGFQPVQSRIVQSMNKTTWRNKEQSTSQEMPSAFLRSPGPLKVLPHPKPDPRASNKTKPVAMKASLPSSLTSSTVRGKRVKGKQDNAKNVSKSTPRSNTVSIVRLPKQPKKAFRGLTYSDILGSASFSSARATTQTPVTPADKYPNIPNITAATKQKEVSHQTSISDDAVFERENSSRGPEEQTEDKVEEFSDVQEKKLDLRSRDTDLKTSDSLQDTEGSGSGDFTLFDGFSIKTDRLSDDLLEVDYLRISAGNVSFKSMNVSSNEK